MEEVAVEACEGVEVVVVETDTTAEVVEAMTEMVAETAMPLSKSLLSVKAYSFCKQH